LESTTNALLARVPENPLIDRTPPDTPLHPLKLCSVVAYSESLLLGLPWSSLHGRNGEVFNSITLGPSDDGPTASAGQWTVSNLGTRVAGRFERSVFRALEWIAIESSRTQGVPFANPLHLHLREICERLCWPATEPQFHAIRQALQTLCGILIEHHRFGTSGLPIRSARFKVLQSAAAERPRSFRRILPATRFIVHFDRPFVDSVNAGRIRAINWALWIAQGDPVARRLLELLESGFAQAGQSGSVTIEIDTLSRLMPFDLSMPPLRARRQLEQAHLRLIRQGYLQSAERLVTGGVERFVYVSGIPYPAMRYRLETQTPLHAPRRILPDVRAFDSPKERKTQLGSACRS
jgi:hypothetical protein